MNTCNAGQLEEDVFSETTLQPHSSEVCVHTCLLLGVPIQAFLETVKSQSTILDLAVTSTGEL